MHFRQWILAVIILAIMTGCSDRKPAGISFTRMGENRFIFQNTAIRLSFNDDLMAHLERFNGKTWFPVSSSWPLLTIQVNNGSFKNTQYPVKIYEKKITNDLGTGQQIILQRSSYPDTTIARIEKVMISLFQNFPNVLTIELILQNNSPVTVNVPSYSLAQLKIDGLRKGSKQKTELWSFQGASYEDRYDWILPLKNGCQRKNYLGMNAPDYGGGVPVTDIWCPDYGIVIGHLDTLPVAVSLPVTVDEQGSVFIQVLDDDAVVLNPGQSFRSVPVFIGVHENDFFDGLKLYADLMKARGLVPVRIPEPAYEPIWCGWGYGREFQSKDLLTALAKVKELGLDWVVVDDGWQTAEGDWFLNPQKFPRLDKDMTALTDSIHHAGLKAKLWWVPLAADPGTKLAKKHKDWFILDQDGQHCTISWWDSYYLCPAVTEIRQYHVDLVRKFINDWGFDGLKIDGQCLNAVPKCYHPAHQHNSPFASYQAVPGLFEEIYQAATAIKPDAVIEICPCGTVASFFNMMWNNQPVASDPTSSWQIRHRGKAFKALMGPHTAYYGDHVELSDEQTDFASTIGIGAVPGTKFTWPEARQVEQQTLLTPAREKHWKKWLGIYNQERIAEGEYLNLYDIAFDKPEGHAIRKNDTLYFSFYADKWDGAIVLRGLADTKYTVNNLETGEFLAIVTGPEAYLDANFIHHILVKAAPIRPEQ